MNDLGPDTMALKTSYNLMYNYLHDKIVLNTFRYILLGVQKHLYHNITYDDENIPSVHVSKLMHALNDAIENATDNITQMQNNIKMTIVMDSPSKNALNILGTMRENNMKTVEYIKKVEDSCGWFIMTLLNNFISDVKKLGSEVVLKKNSIEYNYLEMVKSYGRNKNLKRHLETALRKLVISQDLNIKRFIIIYTKKLKRGLKECSKCKYEYHPSIVLSSDAEPILFYGEKIGRLERHHVRITSMLRITKDLSNFINKL